jgi:cyclopropane fatty-acyl-phospholipid synthase-like methyltransferase
MADAIEPRIHYMDTATAYDLWSEVYDTDGNFLQALDTVEMKKLLPTFVSMLNTPKPWKIVDLGCGTGRNTIALLSIQDVRIIGLDVSTKMLDVARNRLKVECAKMSQNLDPTFETFDMLATNNIPGAATNADAIISTLVVEHVPLDTFFNTAAKILKPDGLLLLTNMHAEMGNISQAGFVDPKTGAKIRPTSYAHTVDDLLQEAWRQGFEIVGKVEERSVDGKLAPRLGRRAVKWVGVRVWFGGIFRKRF